MMKNLLNWQINNLYSRSIKRLPSLIGLYGGKMNGIFNSKREIVLGKQSKNAYEGHMICGAMSHIIYDSVSFPVKKVIYSKGIGRNIDDHVFLYYEDYIICPTYRQMFCSDCGTGDEKYFKMLYEDNPPFFVGNINKLQEMYEVLNKQHLEDFGEELENKMDFYTKATDYNR